MSAWIDEADFQGWLQSMLEWGGHHVVPQPYCTIRGRGSAKRVSLRPDLYVQVGPAGLDGWAAGLKTLVIECKMPSEDPRHAIWQCADYMQAYDYRVKKSRRSACLPRPDMALYAIAEQGCGGQRANGVAWDLGAARLVVGRGGLYFSHGHDRSSVYLARWEAS